MPRPKHKYHYLYKTTNLINQKYYYGMHSTSNLNDGYLGSGTRLRHSIRKYGKTNFKIEILEFFNSREELIEAEIKLITELIINDNLCLNIKLGGTGGFNNKEHQLKCSKAGNNKQSILSKTNKEWIKNKSDNLSKGHKLSYLNGRTKDFKKRYNSTGIKHKDETINKMKDAHKGENNSQYGTCWITKEGINKKIKKEELNQYINSGWIKGRKI